MCEVGHQQTSDCYTQLSVIWADYLALAKLSRSSYQICRAGSSNHLFVGVRLRTREASGVKKFRQNSKIKPAKYLGIVLCFVNRWGSFGGCGAGIMVFCTFSMYSVILPSLGAFPCSLTAWAFCPSWCNTWDKLEDFFGSQGRGGRGNHAQQGSHHLNWK